MIILLGLILFIYSYVNYYKRPEFFIELGNVGFWLILLGLIIQGVK